ncbi:MAG: hypothetical protein HYX94_01010 [Chloroflexi bacterium]|nr:hypothetical protein [Chloroflexota bacterium]
MPYAGTILRAASKQSLAVEGRVICYEDLYVDVDLKLLIVRSRPLLCAVDGYSFHAQRGKLPLFRYDDAKHYPDQPTPHHKHLFDASGAKLEAPEHVGGIPTLAEVLDELGAWAKRRKPEG